MSDMHSISCLLFTGDTERERSHGRHPLVVLGPAGIVSGVVAHHAPDEEGAVGEEYLPLVHGQHLACKEERNETGRHFGTPASRDSLKNIT